MSDEVIKLVIKGDDVDLKALVRQAVREAILELRHEDEFARECEETCAELVADPLNRLSQKEIDYLHSRVGEIKDRELRIKVFTRLRLAWKQEELEAQKKRISVLKASLKKKGISS